MTREHERPLLADRVYGIIAAGMLALALFFALRGGPADGAVDAPPAITILEPTSAAPQPLTLVFDAGAELRPGPTGWGAGGRHLHVRVDESELMPRVGDITRVSGTRYRWVLPRLPAGERTVQLFWSDEAHRPLRTGASAPVRIRLDGR